MQNGNLKLILSLEELERILDSAKRGIEHDSMQESIVIECKNDRITITQHCHYAECNSTYHVR